MNFSVSVCRAVMARRVFQVLKIFVAGGLLTSLAMGESAMPADGGTSSDIRTPPAPHSPRINGPAVYGERPGRPFFYHLPVTGDRPLTITARQLPEGLALDQATGNITGSTATAGTFAVAFTATNRIGSQDRTLSFVIGQAICLTPPMGWNSWNYFGRDINETKIRAEADEFVKTGLIDHGWTYINMDDRWQGTRDSAGNIQGSAGFPDMKALSGYIHGLGLKIGIYSSPGPMTCADGLGSYQHEDQDARTYASWGMDYLKYDLCSYRDILEGEWRAEAFARALPGDAAAIRDISKREHQNWFDSRNLSGDDASKYTRRKELENQWNDLTSQMDRLYLHLPDPERARLDQDTAAAPYRQMRASLDKVNRDIVFSLCQYGESDVWKWGSDVGGNLWRVTGDIEPKWSSVQKHSFDLPPGLAPWAGPGHWNDPDMLEVGNGSLTPDENYTHMTQWCILAAPLLIGCDLTKASPFVLSLFSNDEVLAVNQDPLGRQGVLVRRDATTEVWRKPLQDGTSAVALYNRGDSPASVSVSWTELGISGANRVRDLWRQTDLSPSSDHLTLTVARHGAELVKIGPTP